VGRHQGGQACGPVQPEPVVADRGHEQRLDVHQVSAGAPQDDDRGRPMDPLGQRLCVVVELVEMLRVQTPCHQRGGQRHAHGQDAEC
jgi:hypothetical protein